MYKYLILFSLLASSCFGQPAYSAVVQTIWQSQAVPNAPATTSVSIRPASQINHTIFYYGANNGATTCSAADFALVVVYFEASFDNVFWFRIGANKAPAYNNKVTSRQVVGLYPYLRVQLTGRGSAITNCVVNASYSGTFSSIVDYLSQGNTTLTCDDAGSGGCQANANDGVLTLGLIVDSVVISNTSSTFAIKASVYCEENGGLVELPIVKNINLPIKTQVQFGGGGQPILICKSGVIQLSILSGSDTSTLTVYGRYY